VGFFRSRISEDGKKKNYKQINKTISFH